MLNTIKYYEDKYDIKILYLVKFGSHLYGTNTPASDTDYKGIFLPSKESCYLNNQSKSINYTSGKNNSKNGVDDIDFELWSLQYWFKLLEKGDTNSIDLLYSYSFKDVIEYIDPRMEYFLKNPHKLFDIAKCKGYSGYIKGQVKKYGLKGNMVGVYKSLCKMLDFLKEDLFVKNIEELRLRDLIYDIINECYDKSYCFVKDFDGGKKGLVVCGKVHMEDIKFSEFHERIKAGYDKYGSRAKEAERNKGVDWKAVSHAMRAVYQMKELISTGEIKFPLSKAKDIIPIKLGKELWNDVSKDITNGLNDIDTLIDGLTDHKCKRDYHFIREGILDLYKDDLSVKLTIY